MDGGVLNIETVDGKTTEFRGECDGRQIKRATFKRQRFDKF
jgi:hypothetical protein